MKNGRLMLKTTKIVPYISVFIYCTALFLKRVDLQIDAEYFLNKCMTFSALLALIGVIVGGKMNAKQFVLFCILSVCLFLDSLPTNNHEILYLFFVICSCRNIDKKKMMKFIFRLVLVLTVMVFIGIALGYIQNTLYFVNDVRERYSLGYSVWSILPFQFMAIGLYYLYFKNTKINIFDCLLLVLLAVPIYILTDTKSALAFTCVGSTCMYLLDRKNNYNWRLIKFVRWFPFALAFISYGITYLFIKGNSLLTNLDVILNYRIHFSTIAMKEYGVKIFANPEIYELYSNDDSYFAIDNNYLCLLYLWGLVALFIICIIYWGIVNYSVKRKDIKLLFLSVFIMLVGMMWSRMIVLIEASFLICFSDIFCTNKRFISKEEDFIS